MVEYTVVNFITLAVGVLFLFNGYRIVRSGREDVMLFVVSCLIGSGVIAVALYPNLFTVVASVLGLELKARAILVMSNLTLFFIATYLLNKIGDLNDSVSRLNEEVSLLKTELDERND